MSAPASASPVHRRMPPTALRLLRCADLAMYRAKVGPTPFELYRHDVDDGGNRLRLVEELRSAILDDQLEVHYQPQMDLVTGKRSAMEALVRWRHPRLGLVPPLDFIPLAEEAGLMQSLTAFVLERAVEQCAAWRAAGEMVTISVNVSATNLLDSGFSQSVVQNSPPPRRRSRSASSSRSPRPRSFETSICARPSSNNCARSDWVCRSTTSVPA